MYKTFRSLSPYAGARVRVELRSGVKLTGIMEAEAGQKYFWIGNDRFTPGQVLNIDRTY